MGISKQAKFLYGRVLRIVISLEGVVSDKGQRTKTDLDLLDYDGALIISKLQFKILGKHSSITSEAEEREI